VRLRRTSHPLADEELLEAARYYERAEQGLGLAFLDPIDRTVDEVVEHPKAVPLITRTARRKLLKRFPYAVIYSLPEGRVRVLAIAHLKRRPFYWRRRS